MPPSIQPILSFETGTVVGLEVLLRWDHPDRGILTPDRFLEIAEETGLICPAGTWILQEACNRLATWQRTISGRERLFVCVNISPIQLREPGIVESVQEIVRDAGLDFSALVLEVTESALIRSQNGAIDALKALSDLGLSIYLDDFGTGYSSLGYLNELPRGGLKLDRSFTSRVADRTNGAANIQTIQLIAHNLNIPVVIEGIETAEEFAQARSLGCDMGQGYFFSPAVDAKKAEKMLNSSEWRTFLLEGSKQ